MMWRITMCAFVALVMCALVSPGGLSAQGKKKGSKEAGTLAKVVKVDGDVLTVTMADRKAKKDVEKSFKVDESVKVVSIKEGFKLGDLKAGDEVLLVTAPGNKLKEIRVVTEPK